MKYDGTIDSIQVREIPFTFADLHGLFQSAEMCHEDEESATQLNDIATALYTSKNGPFKGRKDTTSNTHLN